MKLKITILFTFVIAMIMASTTFSTTSADDVTTNLETKAKKKLRHVVMFKFKDSASKAEIKKVEEAFAALPSKISAIKDYEWGINNSPESFDLGYTHCFLLTFDSEEGRAEYLPHPDHKAFGELLGPVLDKVHVMDYWAK